MRRLHLHRRRTGYRTVLGRTECRKCESKEDKGCTFDTTLVISTKNARSIGGHWKDHWLNGTGEAKRIGYVASTRAKYLLVWGVPKMKSEDKELLKSYGFVNGEDLI